MNGIKNQKTSRHPAFLIIWNALNVINNVEDYLEQIPEEDREDLYDHPILKDFDLLP